MKRIFTNADIMLPGKKRAVDMSYYPVIACDQHTSEPEYWEETARITENRFTTLDLILPEVYLDRTDEMIPVINGNMIRYRDSVLDEYRDAVILCERTQKDGRIRRGAVVCVDLECYDFSADSRAEVRATEGTVLSRIPPRVRIRREAALEVPHIMLLINDRDFRIMEPEFERGENLRKLYDTDLMQGGGHIRGFLMLDGGAAMLERLNIAASEDFFAAVGDGNHSLATAKAYYEELKKTAPDTRICALARYALCEIVNIYDDALDFEPIHRIIRGADIREISEASRRYCAETGVSRPAEREMVSSDGRGTIFLPGKGYYLAELTSFLDTFVSEHPGASVDYIHDAESVEKLIRAGNVGVFCDSIGKDSFFENIKSFGVYPRKTFSMGNSCDKRYYLEARRIR